MSAYIHNHYIKEGHVEYSLVNNDKGKIINYNGEKQIDIKLAPKPPLIKNFNISDEIHIENPYKEIKSIIINMFGETQYTTTLSLYIFLTHCYEMFKSIPLLWIKIIHPDINTMVQEFLLNLCLNGMPISPNYKREQILPLINHYSCSFIYHSINSSKNNFIPILTDRKISKDNFELNWVSKGESTYCPKIVLSKFNNSPQGFILPLTIRRCKAINLNKMFKRAGNIHYEIVNCIAENDIEIINIYNDLLATELEVADTYISLLTIAKFLLEKNLIDNNEYSNIQTELVQLSSLNKSILNVDDEIILCIINFFHEKKYKWPIDEFVPLDVLCNYIINNSTLAQNLIPRSLSQFLNKYTLVSEGKRGTRNIDDLEYQLFGNNQPMCIKIKKYKLEKWRKELQ